MRSTPFSVLAGALFLIGCGSSSPTTSTVTGSITQESFPSSVAQITVVGDSGSRAVVPVDAGGAFELTLEQGSSYRFFLSADGLSIPIVIKSDEGRLQTSVTITTGGASADIGSVRFWPGEGAGRIARSNVIGLPPVTEVTPAACVDGVLEGTTQPCASGEAAAVCAQQDEGDCPNMGSGDKGGHGHHHGAADGAGDDAAGAGEPVVQAAAIDTADDASAADAVGVPEHNLPSALGCASAMKKGGGHHGRHGHH